MDDPINKYLRTVLQRDENKVCADCGARGPRWASINLGILVCIECAGVHRNLGVHISKIKSVTLDTWKLDWVQTLAAIGNALSNSYYEFNIPEEYQRATTTTSRQVLDTFIKDKYQRRLFVPPDVKSGPVELLSKGYNPASAVQTPNTNSVQFPTLSENVEATDRCTKNRIAEADSHTMNAVAATRSVHAGHRKNSKEEKVKPTRVATSELDLLTAGDASPDSSLGILDQADALPKPGALSQCSANRPPYDISNIFDVADVSRNSAAHTGTTQNLIMGSGGSDMPRTFNGEHLPANRLAFGFLTSPSAAKIEKCKVPVGQECLSRFYSEAERRSLSNAFGPSSFPPLTVLGVPGKGENTCKDMSSVCILDINPHSSGVKTHKLSTAPLRQLEKEIPVGCATLQNAITTNALSVTVQDFKTAQNDCVDLMRHIPIESPKDVTANINDIKCDKSENTNLAASASANRTASSATEHTAASGSKSNEQHDNSLMKALQKFSGFADFLTEEKTLS